MSAPEEPLHVQVARALGCRPWLDLAYRERHPKEPDNWLCDGWHPCSLVGGSGCRHDIPHFDHDWCSGGPLIEKYHINLEPPLPDSVVLIASDRFWVARARQREDGTYEFGCSDPSPLVAVCHLILKLAAAGKLEAPRA